MWGYTYTTTGNSTVFVYFGGNGTGDVYTYIFNDYMKYTYIVQDNIKWNITATYGDNL